MGSVLVTVFGLWESTALAVAHAEAYKFLEYGFTS
jgi:hypothetical protein